MFIDTHLHLDAAEFSPNRAELWQAARLAGVSQAIVPAVSAANFAMVRQMRDEFGVAVAYGLHPMYLAEHTDAHLELLADYLQRERPVAVGECGLDLFVPGLDPLRQEQLLLAQLRLARRFELPVILHVRRAQDQVLKCLRQVPVRGGVAHAFNGSAQQAEAFIKLGFCLGFGGAMTYQGSQRIRRLAASLPMSAIVLETDGPDIPPEWAQGQPNAPANLARIAGVLAVLRNMSVADIAQETSANARRMFVDL
ncbi:TatD family hydrolase [Vogesella sp. LIG4]|uniref:TatD family hydrolase n=1 Tax=Vogesella sp. LIG4 TaxID=1192162 RepID=UPI00081F77BF|nr:TatD family hydrolase [Vogesella sp. LIG4]SCK14170.1 TatD DNase family protein [Vogesella sp. LIG4]